MKKLFLLLLLHVWATAGFAQISVIPPVEDEPVAPPTRWQQHTDSIFQPLDKSQVPTGYLAEYGVRLLPLANYNGTLTDSSLADLATLRYLRASLQSARIFGSDTLPDVPALNARLRAALVLKQRQNRNNGYQRYKNT